MKHHAIATFHKMVICNIRLPCGIKDLVKKSHTCLCVVLLTGNSQDIFIVPCYGAINK